MPDQSEPLTDQELERLTRALMAVPPALRARSRWSLRERQHQNPSALQAPDGTKLRLGGRGVFIGPDLADWLAVATPELVGRLVAQVRRERGLDEPQEDPQEDPREPQAETSASALPGAVPEAFCYSCASYHAAGECASDVSPNRFFARGDVP